MAYTPEELRETFDRCADQPAFSRACWSCKDCEQSDSGPMLGADWTQLEYMHGWLKRCEKHATERPMAWLKRLDVERACEFANAKHPEGEPFVLDELKVLL